MDELVDDDSGSRSVAPTTTMNELLLSRRLAQVERERDALAAEVNRLRGDDPSASHPQEEHGLSIPPELLPTLSILRSHITTLTRDNEALRCTFLGRPCIADPLDTLGEAGKPKVDGVNLEDVLIRVRELVRENEELGDMVLHAGHADVDALEQALNDSQAVIRSLDSDLEQHIAVVNDLRSQLESYQHRYGSLPGDKDITPVSTGQTSHDKSRRSSASSRGGGPPTSELGGSARRTRTSGMPDSTREEALRGPRGGSDGRDRRRDAGARGRGRGGGQPGGRAIQSGVSHGS